MKEIFTELYKKVLGIFQAQEKEAEESKSVAVNRMKLVLMQDRTNLTPFLLEKMRGELIELLSKYVEMDKEMLELNFASEGDSMALMLSIPVIRAREEEEIKEILKAEEEKTKTEESETEASEEDSEEVTEEPTEEDDVESSCCGLEEVCSCGCEQGEECTCSQDGDCPEEDLDEVEEAETEEVNDSNKKSKK